MRYYLIVGEPSGDLHASNLMRALKEEDEEATFRYWGGDLMAAVGGTLVKHYKETAVMGVWDVLTHLGKIGRNFAACKKDILANRPDALILVDYPGFNLKMAEWAHEQGIKTLYYISPKVWASKEYRIKTMRIAIDRLYSIMPFEPEYFRSRDYDKVFYCGNPVVDAIGQRKHVGETTAEFVERNSLDSRPIVALLPGSRNAELKYNLPEMLRLAAEMPEYQFVIGGAPSFGESDYEKYIAGTTVKVLFGETYSLVSHAVAAVVTSGTATLETGLLGCPQIVMYLMWGGRFSDWVAHLFIKVPYISLVNLILGRESVSELFQNKYSYERLRTELRELCDHTSERRTKMIEDYKELRERVGEGAPSKTAAADMVSYLKKTI
ncbi:MAG: lipid-A-disaccharide synthase [Bacteroidales bacterium]|nr:lipid-A-disaccharide synthase [Bacteroidales bacterium]